MEIDTKVSNVAAIENLRQKIEVAQAVLDAIHCNAGATYTAEERVAAEEATKTVDWFIKQLESTSRRSEAMAK